MRQILAVFSIGCAFFAAGCDSGGKTTTASTAKDAAATGDTAKTDGTVADTGAVDTVTDSSKPDTVVTDIAKPDVKKDTSKPADDLIAGAVEMDPKNGNADDLDPTGDVDFYWFTGKKGDLVQLQIVAQGTLNAFKDDAIDTVITLLGPDQKVYAMNDDPSPRTNNDSTLFTILPADGKYYVRVEECSTWLATAENVPSGAACAKPIDKDVSSYTLYFVILDGKTYPTAKDAETGNDAKSANEVVYKQNDKGQYQAPVVYGYFTDASDVDVFAVKLPSEFKLVDGKRPTLAFETFAAGPLGNGSTTTPGLVSVANAATPTDWLAQADFTVDADEVDLSMPATMDANYLLYVPHKGDKKGTNDFYILVHSFYNGNPVEQKEKDNDKLAGAEVLVNGAAEGALPRYYIEGDLADKDVDYFSFSVKDVPATATSVFVTCSGQNSGSNLRGLTASLEDKDSASLGSGSETNKKKLAIEKVLIPKGAQTLYLKLSVDSHEAKISGNYYRCGIGIYEPKTP